MSAERQQPASVCTLCGVTCDDIVLRAVGDKIVAAENACSMGRDYFVGHRIVDRPPTIDGDKVTLDEACELAAEWLAAAQIPAIVGIANCSTEAQRAAVALADRAGAIIDSTSSDADASAVVSLQTVGSVTATWGEVAQRAETVIYWASDPAATHPRMAERYTEAPTSRWLPNGRADRHVVVVDEFVSTTKADETVRIVAGSHYLSLAVLRALTKGIALDANDVKVATGVSLGDWQKLHARMMASKFGAIVYGKRLAGEGPATLSALTQLMADLTAKTRWVALGEGAYGNATGAASVMAWQAGAPMAVDFSQGVPRYRPLEANWSLLIDRGECDVVLSFERGVAGPLLCVRHAGDAGEIIIPTATPGVDAGGTTYRSDGVALPLRAILSSSLPKADDVLRSISSLLSMSSTTTSQQQTR